MRSKSDYFLDKDEFVIRNYNTKKPFSSFLPGIAGLTGKPAWAFYVNRAQGISSFGIKNKDNAIMEFFPANQAYARTSLEGFRTFISIKNKGKKPVFYEPFSISKKNDSVSEQDMHITPHELRICDYSKKHKLKTEVVYFSVPNDDFPGILRMVNIHNLSNKNRDIRVLDGMPKIMPLGMNQFFSKHMSRTIEAWMGVEGLEEKHPFFKFEVSAQDVSKVDYIKSGNFYLTVSGGSKCSYIVDPGMVFENFMDFTYPVNFISEDFLKGKNLQKTKNITPCCFHYSEGSLKANASRRIYSLIGFANDTVQLKQIKNRFSIKYASKKRSENKDIVEEVSGSTSVFSGLDIFDAYIKQTNLDNILRGGYPLNIADAKTIYVYNRKHGDLERDYNNFSLDPEYYAQGNGNYRDTNQNRRGSIFINPKIHDKDIIDFYSLIQLDGYNPLIVAGDVFSVSGRKRKKIIGKYFKNDKNKVSDFLNNGFTPGKLYELIKKTKTIKSKYKVFEDIIKSSTSAIDAKHGEGFWVDHWTYNMDLLESYDAIYPDKFNDMFFYNRSVPTYISAHYVRSRGKRYVADDNGSLMQHSSVGLDEKMQGAIDLLKPNKKFVKLGKNSQKIFTSTVFEKNLFIIANKIASLDPKGRGVEMEAGKPGWCDSLNGLPGIFGSSICETAELLRLVYFIKEKLSSAENIKVKIPSELSVFINGLAGLIKRNIAGSLTDFEYWDSSNFIKEKYRDDVRCGVKAAQKGVDVEALSGFLSLCTKKLKSALQKNTYKKQIPCTYYIHDFKRSKSGKVSMKNYRPIPLFLEGPSRILKVIKDQKKAESLYRSVKKSDLYDNELKMYRLNNSLKGESIKIGRSRIFTPGWLENQSVWLHMEYKYLLGILQSGLYDEFYGDFFNSCVCFQPPERYGRSILENSSFIASSLFYDKHLRGTGFIARLSGATTEMLHILRLINMGPKPFKYASNRLIFKPEPILNKKMFTKNKKQFTFTFKNGKENISVPSHSYAFSLFENVLIIYHNPKSKNTYGKNKVRPVKVNLTYNDGKNVTVNNDFLDNIYSTELRRNKIKKIDILLD